MITATLNTKKPSHRLPPAEGAIPTPVEETKMLTTVHPPTDTTQAADWRDLLDDLEVLRIIRQETQRSYWTERDPVLIDDKESFLTQVAVDAARSYVRKPAPTSNADNAWYKYLRTSLRRAAGAAHVKAIYGAPGTARRSARPMTWSMEAALDASPSVEQQFAPIVALPARGRSVTANDVLAVIVRLGEASPAALRSDLGVAVGDHLMNLKKAGRIRSPRAGVYVSVDPTPVRSSRWDGHDRYGTGRIAEVKAIAQQRPVRARDIATRFGISANKATDYLRELVQVGALVRLDRGLYAGHRKVAA